VGCGLERPGEPCLDSRGLTGVAEIRHLVLFNIQGADYKLEQLLNQSIKATDYRRNVFQLSLESCTSLVLRNVNKLSLFLKTYQQCCGAHGNFLLLRALLNLFERRSRP
jgi:hypothetical protein